MGNQKTLGTIIALVIIPIILVVGALAYIGISWHNNKVFEEEVYANGPWGSENTWVSTDKDSYLVGEKNKDNSEIIVTAYFKDGNQWVSYEIYGMNRQVSLNKLQDGVVVQSNGGNMEFKNDTFVIKDLHEGNNKGHFPKDEYHYQITNEKFTPDK